MPEFKKILTSLLKTVINKPAILMTGLLHSHSIAGVRRPDNINRYKIGNYKEWHEMGLSSATIRVSLVLDTFFFFFHQHKSIQVRVPFYQEHESIQRELLYQPLSLGSALAYMAVRTLLAVRRQQLHLQQLWPRQ